MASLTLDRKKKKKEMLNAAIFLVEYMGTDISINFNCDINNYLFLSFSPFTVN